MSLDEIFNLYAEGASQLINQVLQPSLSSGLSMLLGLSAIAWAFETLRPWRINQGNFRKDFGLDAFYSVFNFFLAPWLFLNLVYQFSDKLVGHHLEAASFISVASSPGWVQITLLFFIQDFSHYWIHRLLHRVPFLWRYHRVHHSVEEMGFAAHLRYHWMENLIYRSLGAIPFYFIGFSPLDLFWVYLISISIGHLNHSNLKLTYGPLRWIINHPVMHLWHHAETIPEGHRYGVNYGISLSLWDMIFKTGVWHTPPAELKLGFKNRDLFPNDFINQNLNLLGPSLSLSEDQRP